MVLDAVQQLLTEAGGQGATKVRAVDRVGTLREQLADAGLDRLCVEVASDRHWIAWGELAGET